MERYDLDPVLLITLLYAAGVACLIAEVFIPSGGVLTACALISLGAAVYLSFVQSTTAGLVGMLMSVLVVPGILVLGIKYIRYTPLGRYVAPPYVARKGDASADAFEACIGREGVAVTALRPVGQCEFDGTRVACVAESGMIEEGTRVVGVAVRVNQLAVRRVAAHSV